MQKFSRLKRPIYITETGIPDAKDRIRAEWAEAYFKAVRSLAQAALLRGFTNGCSRINKPWMAAPHILCLMFSLIGCWNGCDLPPFIFLSLFFLLSSLCPCLKTATQAYCTISVGAGMPVAAGEALLVASVVITVKLSRCHWGGAGGACSGRWL